MLGDFFGIFTGKNDLVKFLAIGGLFFVVFSLLYPMEKKKELDNIIARKNGEIRELNLRIDYLKECNRQNDSINKSINNIALTKKISEQEKIYYLQRLDEIDKEVAKRTAEVNTQAIKVESLEEQKLVNKRYAKEYENYLNYFFWFGVVASFIGFVFWIISGIIFWNKERKKP